MKDCAGKRILIIVQNLPVPFDRRVWLEATTLTKEGYKVSVISPRSKAEKNHTVVEGVSLYRYRAPLNSQGFLGYLFEFSYCWIATFLLSLVVAAREGIDVVHACNPPDTFFLIGAFYKLFGKKFVFDHHDLAPEMYLAKYERTSRILHRALLLLEKMTFRTAQAVLATNESHKQIALNRGRMDEQQVFVVRSGPDFERLRVLPPEDRLKEKRRFMIAYLGEMCPQDGVDYLLRSAKIMKDSLNMDDVLFVIMGGGPALEKSRCYANELGLEGYVKFTGRVSDEDLCRYLSTADVCVDPDPLSEWSDKSTMNKILEYMAFGKPIVAYDLNEHRRSAGFAAVYARPNDEYDFASHIKSLLKSRGLRRRMGRLGRWRVEHELSWDHTKLGLLEAYEWLCSEEEAVHVHHPRKEETVAQAPIQRAYRQLMSTV